jgi:hypothetical protein
MSEQKTVGQEVAEKALALVESLILHALQSVAQPLEEKIKEYEKNNSAKP